MQRKEGGWLGSNMCSITRPEPWAWELGARMKKAGRS